MLGKDLTELAPTAADLIYPESPIPLNSGIDTLDDVAVSIHWGPICKRAEKKSATIWDPY